jgi:hypothetical protein
MKRWTGRGLVHSHDAPGITPRLSTPKPTRRRNYPQPVSNGEPCSESAGLGEASESNLLVVQTSSANPRDSRAYYNNNLILDSY